MQESYTCTCERESSIHVCVFNKAEKASLYRLSSNLKKINKNNNNNKNMIYSGIFILNYTSTAHMYSRHIADVNGAISSITSADILPPSI